MEESGEYRKIAINIGLNIFKFRGERLTPEWIKNRLDIFEQYTLKSLKAQTNQSFNVYFSYDPLSEEIIRAELQKRKAWPENIYVNTLNQNMQHLKKWIKGSDFLLLVRLDSDDMYEKHFIQKLYEVRFDPTTEALINCDGYIYSAALKKISDYHHYSPPFFVLIYKTEDFLAGKRYKYPGGHGSVAKLLKYEYLEGKNFMVSITSGNTTSGEWLLRNRSAYAASENSRILEQFGITL